MHTPCFQHHGEENQRKTHVSKPSARIKLGNGLGKEKDYSLGRDGIGFSS